MLALVCAGADQDRGAEARVIPEVEAALHEHDRALGEHYRRSLRAFVRAAWPIVEPDQPYVHNWHIDALCDVLEGVTRGETPRVVANVPPGTGKSLIVNVLWPAWEWATNPALRIFTASYSADLSIRDNVRFRAIVQSDWYRRCWPHVDLSGDQRAKERLATTTGGWRIATSVCGFGTGEHPDRIIIDDPHSAEQARSDLERARGIAWCDGTISSRGVVRDRRIVVIMQRLHERDLSAHLLAKGDWEHVCWPMRYDLSRPDPRDPRRIEGSLLWPSLFTEAKVAKLAQDLGRVNAAGQLQQLPVPPEGGDLFQRAWFKVVDKAPQVLMRVRRWDFAATVPTPGKDPDWTVGALDGKDNEGRIYVEDVIRFRGTPGEVEERVRHTAMMDGPDVLIVIPEDPGQAGKAQVHHYITRVLPGFRVIAERETGGKESRWLATSSQSQQGNVYLVRGEWNTPFLSEAEAAPFGSYDDQLDSVCGGVNKLLTMTYRSPAQTAPLPRTLEEMRALQMREARARMLNPEPEVGSERYGYFR